MISLEPTALMAAFAKGDAKLEPKSEPRSGAGEDDFATWVANDTLGELDNGDSSNAATDRIETGNLGTAALLSIERLGLSGVIYGWQLEAQQGLSQLHQIGSLEALLQGASEPRGEMGKSSHTSSTLRARAQGSASHHAGQWGGAQFDGARSVSLLVSPVNTTGAGNKIEQTAYAALASSLTWSERNLRLLPNADGNGSTLWLRDYRLDPEQVEATVKTLIEQQTGSDQVTRIVINGVEVWRRTPPQSPEKA